MKEHYKALGSYGTLGIEIVLCILFGFGIGHWIDGKLGSDPWGAVLGFGFGVGAAIKALMRSVKEMQAVAEREEREQGNPAPLFDAREEREERERKEREERDERAAATTKNAEEHDDGRP